MKKRELKELIEQGEGYFAEFKEQIGVSIDKEWVMRMTYRTIQGLLLILCRCVYV